MCPLSRCCNTFSFSNKLVTLSTAVVWVCVYVFSSHLFLDASLHHSGCAVASAWVGHARGRSHKRELFSTKRLNTERPPGPSEMSIIRLTPTHSISTREGRGRDHITYEVYHTTSHKHACFPFHSPPPPLLLSTPLRSCSSNPCRRVSRVAGAASQLITWYQV